MARALEHNRSLWNHAIGTPSLRIAAYAMDASAAGSP
jgi:hypothetical protein